MLPLETKGWKQKEFAITAGVTQQTVSRWEQGVSRPRAKELPNLAALLGAELSAMTAAAAYALPDSSSSQPEGAPTYDVPLPLHSLRPDSFENFSADFLARYYRSRAGVVNRFGGTGSKQYGIDIEVRGSSFGVHTFQCKRVEEFGAQRFMLLWLSTHMYQTLRSCCFPILRVRRPARPSCNMRVGSYGIG